MNSTLHEANWAGNYGYGAARLHYPETVEQIREIVARSAKVKALGTRHSFNDIADTVGDLVSLRHLDRIVSLDSARRQVTIEAGVRYGELSQSLHNSGYALPNMASLPHISVAGAVATATHGSGERNACLAASAAAMELVTAGGDLVTLSREKDGAEFDGAVVHLGGLGVVTKLTLDVVPAFDVRQVVYDRLPFEQAMAHFDEIESSAYSVSLFTDWRGETFDQAWLKSRVTHDPEFAPPRLWLGATLADGPRHPIRSMPAENCTEQLGVPGPWHDRLPHFRMGFTPSSGEELQSEYIVPRRNAVDALRALHGLRGRIAPLLQICEVRAVAADTLWMSPFYNRASVALHFTWKQEWPAVEALLPLIEDSLAPFAARPHWGKLFTLSPARLRALYEKLPEFERLLRRFDPDGKFRNGFLDMYFDAPTRRD